MRSQPDLRPSSSKRAPPLAAPPAAGTVAGGLDRLVSSTVQYPWLVPDLFTVILSIHETSVRERARALLAGYESVEVVAECTGGEQTLRLMREHEPSLVLLDAQMPEPGAFEIVNEIGPDAMPSVVFVTEFDSAILRVLAVHSINYLLLPFDEAHFQSALERALRQTEKRALAGARRRLARMLAADEEGSKERRIPIRNAGKVQFVDLDDIRWVEGVGTLARLHLDDRTHVIKAELDELAERFADDFVRIHSILVRTSEIAEILRSDDGDPLIKLRDGKHIRLTQGERPQVLWED